MKAIVGLPQISVLPPQSPKRLDQLSGHNSLHHRLPPSPNRLQPQRADADLSGQDLFLPQGRERKTEQAESKTVWAHQFFATH